MLPRVLRSDHLVRLRVYAPFVRKLNIFNHYTYLYKLVNWESTQAYTDKHPLLPNLTSVRLVNHKSRSCPQPIWVRMFIPPGLREISGSTSQPDTKSDNPVRTTRAVLKKLLGYYSDFRSLDLLSSITLGPGQISEIPLYTPVPDVRADYSSRLTEMTITLPVLSSFVQLDYPPFSVLEHLRVYVAPFLENENTDSPSSVQDFFPEVRKLAVLDISSENDLRRVWRELGPAASQLTHVELGFWVGHAEVLDEELSFLAIRSPQVIDLRLSTISRPTALVSKESLLLNRLSLDRLCFKNSSFVSFLPPDFRPGQAFRELKALELPDYRVAPLVLPLFAETMPLLEYLLVDLQLHDGVKFRENSARSRSTALRRLESKFTRDLTTFTVEVLGARSKLVEKRYTSALEFTRYV